MSSRSKLLTDSRTITRLTLLFSSKYMYMLFFPINLNLSDELANMMKKRKSLLMTSPWVHIKNTHTSLATGSLYLPLYSL